VSGQWGVICLQSRASRQSTFFIQRIYITLLRPRRLAQEPILLIMLGSRIKALPSLTLNLREPFSGERRDSGLIIERAKHHRRFEWKY